MDFDARAINARAGERPFGNPSLADDEMTRIAPVRVGERRKDIGKCGPHGFRPDVSRAGDIRTRRCFKDAIVRHERHEGIDVMPIPGIGEILKRFNGHLVRHNGSLAR